MIGYNPRDWYWKAEDGRVYSSAREAIIAANDPAWAERQANGSWTPWPVDERGDQTDDAFLQVIAPLGLALGLDGLKERLKAAVDTAAEAERLRYITPGAGQAMTYSRKVEEARAVQSADEPEADDYPLLAASIGIDGDDIEAVAATVLAMDTAWAQVGAAIERARLIAKRDIDAAADADAARAVSPSWP